MSTTTNVSAENANNGLIRGARIAAMVLARLFMLGIVVQVFLVGISLFESAKYWDDHKSFGEMLGIVPILLVFAAIIGRLPSRLIGMSVALVMLWVIQYMLPEVDIGWIAALHPLNAFLLFGLSAQIAGQIQSLIRRPA